MIAHHYSSKNSLHFNVLMFLYLVLVIYFISSISCTLYRSYVLILTSNPGLALVYCTDRFKDRSLASIGHIYYTTFHLVPLLMKPFLSKLLSVSLKQRKDSGSARKCSAYAAIRRLYFPEPSRQTRISHGVYSVAYIITGSDPTS